MKIIDRYLLWHFIKAFFVFFISLTGLYIVIDVFGNLDEFLTYGRRTGSLFGVLADYYGARAISFFDLTSGLLTLIAAMFTMAWLRRHNEMTALMSAGLSKARIVTPLIVAVVIIAGLAAVNREVVIPSIRDKLARNAQDWMGETARQMRPRYDNQTEIFLGGRHTFGNEQRIEKPCFRLPGRFDRFGTQLVAKNAYYEPKEAARPGGYLLTEVTQPANLAELPSAAAADRTVIFSPKDHDWLEPDQCFVASGLSFEHLEQTQSWRQYASTWELIGSLHNPSLGVGPDVRVAIHSRFVQPLLDVTLLFLGLPLVLTRKDRNVFAAIGLCLLVVGAFFVVVLTCHGMGTNYYLFSPALAAWFPLMLFIPLAIGISESLRE